MANNPVSLDLRSLRDDETGRRPLFWDEWRREAAMPCSKNFILLRIVSCDSDFTTGSIEAGGDKDVADITEGR